MSIEGFLGNRQIVLRLQRAVENRRLPHALMFAGPEGVGKRRLAVELAAWINCEQPGRNWGCGICSSCRRILQHGENPDIPLHADVRVLRPQKSEFSVEQIRDWTAEIAFRPSEGRARFFIFDGADRTTEAAANALLKTLEEPPADCYLIFVTERPSALLPTIRSRCQTVRFAPLTAEEVREALTARDMQHSEAALRADYSEGSLARALQLDVERLHAVHERALNMLQAALKSRDAVEILRLSGKDREQARETLLGALHLLRQTQRLILTAGEASEQDKQLAALAGEMKRAEFETLADGVLAALRDLDNYANPQMVLDAVFLKML